MDMKDDICITGMGAVSSHGLTLESILTSLREGIPCEEGNFAHCADGSVFIDETKFLENCLSYYPNGLEDNYRNAYALEAAQKALIDAGNLSYENIGTVISCSRPTLGRKERWCNAVNKYLTKQNLNTENIALISRVDAPSFLCARKIRYLRRLSQRVIRMCDRINVDYSSLSDDKAK